MELLQVLFSLNESRKQRPLPGHVVISPVETAWNDFGYKIRCEFKVCVSNKARIIEGSMLIGFLSPEKFSDENKNKFYEKKETLSEHLRKSKQNVVVSSDLPPFFTLLPDLQSYRDSF